MKLTALLVAIMVIVNWSDYGVFYFFTWLLTGSIIWYHEQIRNIMIGCYIVGGFWFFLAG